MANVPQYDTRNFSFGPGILYIAPYDVQNDRPAYPYIDVGAVRAGATLRVSREILDVVQGAPDLIVKSFVRSETVELSVTSIEWKIDNLYTALGGGQKGTNFIRFGGDMDLDLYTLRFVHETPAGDLWVIKLWKANPTGELEINFGNDDVHEFALNFRGLKSNYGFVEATQNIGTGNGTTTTFSGTLSNAPIVPYSVSVYAGTVFAGRDNGTGTLSGPLLDSTGNTINYSTGAISVKFTTAPANGTTIKVSYAYYTPLAQTAAVVEITKVAAT